MTTKTEAKTENKTVPLVAQGRVRLHGLFGGHMHRRPILSIASDVQERHVERTMLPSDRFERRLHAGVAAEVDAGRPAGYDP